MATKKDFIFVSPYIKSRIEDMFLSKDKTVWIPVNHGKRVVKDAMVEWSKIKWNEASNGN